MKNISFLIFFFSFSAHALITDVVENNDKGIEFLKKQNFSKAQENFTQAMTESPYSTELQLNLGLTFDGIGQPEKALQSYVQATKIAKDPKLLFASYFNQAEIMGRQKKIPEALALYQKALEIVPHSIEAKTNIELLTQEQQGGGQGESQDQNQKDNQDQKKDQKDGQGKKEEQKGEQKEEQKDQKKNYTQGKPQPKPFKSAEISKDDAKKILDELDRQEQRVRAEYNKKQRKEKPHGKDW